MNEILAELSPLFTDYTFLVVATGTAVLGILCGIVGSFIVLRREALLGDCIAHSSYPGLILAFMIMGVKSFPGQMLGAFLSALVALGILIFSQRTTRLPFDGALAAILSSFFGVGIVLMSIVQRMDNANQAGLKTFIFGQASTMLYEDIIFILSLGIPIVLLILFFWKELKAVCFDLEYSLTIGLPVNLLQTMLVFMTIITVLLAIQSVGIILMTALLVAPAVGARQWTRSLESMVFLAGLFGGVSAIGGTVISSLYPKIPTGPSIVVIASVLVMVSILFSPQRGLITGWLRHNFSHDKKKGELL